MSDQNKFIIFTICLILIIFITSGTTYLVVSNITENSNNPEEPEKESPLTLTSTELNNYLKYIPKSSTDYEGNLFYSINKITVDDISDADLIGTALGTKTTGTIELDTEVASVEEINNLVKKMYNQSVSPNETEFITDGINMYGIKGDKYITIDYTNFPTYYPVIDKYKVTKDEIIIYTYVALKYSNNDFLETPNGETINNFTSSSTKEIIEYIKEHKQEFPLFKHTYQKNGTAYSWYSTENLSIDAS